MGPNKLSVHQAARLCEWGIMFESIQADITGHASRFLLGTSQYTKGNAKKVDSGSWPYRPAENWLFFVGMGILCVGFCFGWLSMRHRLVRYKEVIWMRIILAIGHFVLAAWGGIGGGRNDFSNRSDFIYLDYLCWNVLLAIVNLIHMCHIIDADRTIRLHPSLDQLWKNMFGPDHYNLEKFDFYNLVIDRCQIKEYGAQQVLFNEQDCPGSLNILVEGKMVIYKTDDWGRREVILPVFQDDSNKDHVEMIVGEVDKFEFIDSFEWLAHGLRNNHAQVTIKAETECILVSWDYDALAEVFKDSPRLRACIMAMAGKDISEKLLAITGRTLCGHNDWSDMVRKKAQPWDCFKDAGLKRSIEVTKKEPPVLHHPAFDMDEVVARLRIANARMLALHPSPLENLQPSAGVSSNAEHGAKLLNFFRRVVPDLPQRDLHELLKWGKWREYRKKFTIFLRKGEVPYYVGVVLDGQLDVLDENETTSELKFKHSVKEFELVGSEEFGSKQAGRSKRTIRVASDGAVLFLWDTKDLTRLMLADPRVESVISTLLRGDVTLKLRDSQSLTNRVCGDIDAVRRNGDGTANFMNAMC